MIRNLVLLKVFNGLTASEIARRSGLSISTVCRIQAGKNRPTLDSQRKISEALGVDSTWLFEIDSEGPQDE